MLSRPVLNKLKLPLRINEIIPTIKVGKNILPHRVAHAPTTRFRAAKNHTPSDLQLEYYKTHSQYPGTLIITEATFTSEQGGMDLHVPEFIMMLKPKLGRKSMMKFMLMEVSVRCNYGI